MDFFVWTWGDTFCGEETWPCSASNLNDYVTRSFHPEPSQKSLLPQTFSFLLSMPSPSLSFSLSLSAPPLSFPLLTFPVGEEAFCMPFLCFLCVLFVCLPEWLCLIKNYLLFSSNVSFWMPSEWNLLSENNEQRLVLLGLWCETRRDQ